METENNSEAKTDAGPVPKTIALQVPSLFIKSSSSSSSQPESRQSSGQADDKHEKKKISRPMPGSIRKKLEQSEDSNSTEPLAEPDIPHDPPHSEESDRSASPHKKPSRPMPASARKKLEESKPKDDLSQATNVEGHNSDKPETPEIHDSNDNVNQQNHTPSPKRVSKPMPASARKRLNESNAEEKSTNNGNDTLSDADGDTRDSSVREDHQKTKISKSKPMPASVRKKLGETDSSETKAESDGEATDASKKSTSQDSNNTPKAKRRPMPASAKKKLETSGLLEEDHGGEKERRFDQDDSASDVSQKVVAKAMPGSAEKKLGTTVDDDNGDSDLNTKTDKSKTISHLSKKSNRPMPASARRKLEKTNQDNNVDTSDAREDESTETRSNGDPDSARKDPSMDENSNESESTEKSDSGETSEAKKINISLGGIKFPTFKKPMPTSIRKKLENLRELDQNDEKAVDSSDSHEQGEDKAASESSRRGRSSKSISNKELQSLTDEKHCCQYCDYEAYSLYAKDKHEQGHFKVKDPSETTKKDTVPKAKSSKKVVKRESKYKDFCPHCDKRIGNRKKLAKHAWQCRRRERLKCKTCGKQFNKEADIRLHNEQLHSGNQDESLNISQEHDDDEPSVDRSPSPSPSNSSVKSTKSVISDKSDDQSITEQQSKASSNDKRSKSMNSFKRKIANVLSNLESRLHKRKKHKSDEDTTENDKDEPPRKKPIISGNSRQKNESIRGLAMPESVRKKLEDRDKEGQTTATSSGKRSKELPDTECEVCHRVFTQSCNRQRHERTVHSIQQPRFSSASVGKQQQQKEQKSKGNTTTAPKKPKASLTLEDIPKRGKCPICYKFISTRLRRHARSVHKIPFSTHTIANTSSGTVTAAATKHTPIVRSSVAKSYKIYKSAADKAKKKLTSNPVPVPPTKQPQASTKPTVDVSATETKLKKSEEPKPKTEQKKPAASSASALPTEFSCPCCNEVFIVKIDFNEHMTKRHPKQKRLITCKLCLHMFSHEDDFILHIQFKHKDLVSGMAKQEQAPPKRLQKLPDTTARALHSGAGESKASNHTRNQDVTTMSASRKSLRRASTTNVEDFNVAAVESCPKLSIGISKADKLAADDVLRHPENSPKTTQQSLKSNDRRSRRQRSPSPEPMDTYYDDGPASPAGLDDSSSMEIEESGIAITATFSQRTSPRKAAGPSASTSDDRNKMPCSACNEFFYSFEALRKHELYFHNMQTSKMCPICGVYPTRLSRHLLAHENKTVKCSCAPCDLNFADFASLLKHNLKNHPETNGGAVSVANKNTTKESSQSLRGNQAEESFRCKLCKKEISGGSHARRHVRRAHPECEDYADSYLDKLEKEDDDSMDVSNILEDTNKKLLQSDWDDNDDYTPASPIPASSKPSSEHGSTKKPKRPLPASIRAKLEAKKNVNESTTSATSQSKPSSSVKRPLPASIRAKLQGKKHSDEPATSVTQNIPTLSAPKSVKRPLPASIKAKLEQKKADGGQKNDDIIALGKSTPATLPKPGRPMPASMRAKLMSHSQKGSTSIISDTTSNSSKISASQDKPKPGRMMPASMRAKLESKSQKGPASVISDTASNSSKASSSRDKPKPKRPMPASARARLLNKAELKEVAYSPAPSPDPIVYNDDSNSNHSFVRPRKNDPVESGRNASARSHEVVTLEDDDDDVAVVAVIQDSVPIPVAQDALGFNIADEIANHNRTVQVVVVHPTSSTGKRSSKNVTCTYKCKLCERTFDSGDDIRDHIQRDHDEYGAEHTENLIDAIYQETMSDVSRRRRSNVNYNKSYRHDEEEAEEEVIVSRGTSTRPRGSGVVVQDSPYPHAEPGSSPAISHSVENMEPSLLLYACKFCGKRMDIPGNVKRHISKAHPGMKGLYEDDVVLLEPGREHEFVPQFKEVQGRAPLAPQKLIPPVVASVALDAVAPIEIQRVGQVEMPPPVGFKCKICQKTMDRRPSIVQHICRSHPEIKSSAGGDIGSFIQDVYENNLLNSAISDMESSVETFSCGFCSFQTTDEHDYVRHYKKHTGVSPYHCQYCSATFNRQQQLTGHITREHTGAEFLNDDEAEISMEEMVGVGEISVSTATRIQIDHPKVISLNPRFTGEDISPPETDSLETPKVSSAPEQVEPDSENAGIDEGDNGVEMENNDDNELEEQPEETESFPLPYQGDLSSLFPTLGGSEAPGSLADIDGGMDLD